MSIPLKRRDVVNSKQPVYVPTHCMIHSPYLGHHRDNDRTGFTITEDVGNFEIEDYRLDEFVKTIDGQIRRMVDEESLEKFTLIKGVDYVNS